MNQASKITILICLLVLNIWVWFVFLPQEKKELNDKLSKIQLENMDMYFTNQYIINNSYNGADKFFKIDKDKYFVDIRHDSYCVVDLETQICIDGFNHIIKKTNKCINRKCNE